MALGWIDLGVLIAYFLITLLIGLIAGRRERGTDDFFLGGRRQHWLLAGMSIIATEVSAVTLIAVPAEAYRGDWSYLQMYVGSFAGRVAIAFVLLPAFYGGAVTTVYEYLGQRFGPATRTTASMLFFASRLLGSGIRLLIASLAISVIFDWPLYGVIAASAGVAIVYAAVGGIKAIMWTDAFQALIFVGASVVAVAVILRLTPGTWAENIRTAYEAGKFHTFTWSGGINDDKVFWLLTLNAFFTTMAALGTDQDMTQRMLTCPDLRGGQRSLLFNAFAGLPIVCAFLLIGTLLHVYYAEVNGPAGDSPGAAAVAADETRGEFPEGAAAIHQSEAAVRAAQNAIGEARRAIDDAELGDRVFPYFIATALPNNVGLKGLMITAIFAAAMSSLSSAIGALATTAVNDLYRRARPTHSDRHYLSAARVFTVAFGGILVLVAIAFADSTELLWKVFQWVGLVFGGMLGIFLLGVTTRRRGRDGLNVIAMLSSVLLLGALKQYQESRGIVIAAWPWWVVIGTVWTYVMAALGGGKNSERMKNGESRMATG